MDLQSEKIELVKLVLQTEDIEVINALKTIFKSQGNDFYDDFPQHVKDSIEIGIKEIEDENVVEHGWMIQYINQYINQYADNKFLNN